MLVSLAPKILMLKANLQCNGIWRWGLQRGLGHEGGVLMNGTDVLLKETLESSLLSSLPVRSQQEDARLCTRKQAVTRHLMCQHLDLELPRFPPYEKQMLLVSVT